ncbi:MAG: DUF975 family protein [Clostridia bacterium]|nr:DUF975 family protein [Clostridia bacterium]
MKRSELKKAARMQLGNGIFKTPWLMVGWAILIVGAIEGALSFTAIGTFLVVGPLSYGLARLTVNRVRHPEEDVKLEQLFSGFTENFGATVLLGLLQNLFIFFWSLLLVIPGIVKSYSYSMASFIQQDAEDKDWKVCIDASRKMMKGHKWELFVLDLSFLGWYILGALCFGIGVFFVAPYHELARANFYEALKNETPEVV